MLSIMIAIMGIIAAVILWVISTQQKLILIDESISHAMGQIGVKLSSCLDLLSALVDMMRANALKDCNVMDATLKLKRVSITARSTPNDVLSLELFLCESLDTIQRSAARNPVLMENPSFVKTLEAALAYEGLVRTNRLIYNEGVTKLNREIKRFPSCLIAGSLGFKNRAYIQEATGLHEHTSKGGFYGYLSN